MAYVFELNDRMQVSFKGRTLIKFGASWCVPCKNLQPALAQAAMELAHTRFYQVDIEDSPELARRFNIMSIPTLVLLEDGEVKDIMVIKQTPTKEQIRQFVLK